MKRIVRSQGSISISCINTSISNPCYIGQEDARVSSNMMVGQNRQGPNNQSMGMRTKESVNGNACTHEYMYYVCMWVCANIWVSRVGISQLLHNSWKSHWNVKPLPYKENNKTKGPTWLWKCKHYLLISRLYGTIYVKLVQDYS